MYMANLRKVGGSVMLAVPPAILEMLDMDSGTAVSMEVDGKKLVISPQRRKKYTLGELLAGCDAAAAPSAEDRAWTSGAPAGEELV